MNMMAKIGLTSMLSNEVYILWETNQGIMHGMKWDNPDCIHSVDEAIKYINEFGFLPLLIDSNRWFLCNNGGD